MAVGEDQTQAHLRYMSVPEKIELGGVGERGAGSGGMYKPMKVDIYNIYNTSSYRILISRATVYLTYTGSR